MNKLVAMLSKIRHFVNFSTFKSIDHVTFGSQLSHSLLVWAQNTTSFKTISFLEMKIQKKYGSFEKNAPTSI